MVEGHHEYLITGKGYLGSYEVLKRFREFHAFRAFLEQAWPGVYIPPVPRKKLFVIPRCSPVLRDTRRLPSSPSGLPSSTPSASLFSSIRSFLSRRR